MAAVLDYRWYLNDHEPPSQWVCGSTVWAANETLDDVRVRLALYRGSNAVSVESVHPSLFTIDENGLFSMVDDVSSFALLAWTPSTCLPALLERHEDGRAKAFVFFCFPPATPPPPPLPEEIQDRVDNLLDHAQVELHVVLGELWDNMKTLKKSVRTLAENDQSLDVKEIKTLVASMKKEIKTQYQRMDADVRVRFRIREEVCYQPHFMPTDLPVASVAATRTRLPTTLSRDGQEEVLAGK
jgi:hypothetical protein